VKQFSIKARQLMCVFFFSLIWISGANGQFNKVEELYIPAGVLGTFQKEGSSDRSTSVCIISEKLINLSC